MHFTTNLRIVFEGLFPSPVKNADTEGVRAVQKKNWTRLGIGILITGVLITAMWILTGVYLTGPEHYFMGFSTGNIAFAVGSLTVSLLVAEWTIHKFVIPVSLMAKLWPRTTAQALVDREDDYLITSEDMTKDFWKSQNRKGKQKQKRNPKEENPDLAEDFAEVFGEELEDGQSRSYDAETVRMNKSVAANHQTMITLSYLGVLGMAAMIIMAIVFNVKNLMVSLVWVAALIMLAGVVVKLLKVNRTKASKKAAMVRNALVFVVILAILGGAAAWSFTPFRTNVLTNLGSAGKASMGLSSGLDQGPASSVNTSAENQEPAATSEFTPSPEPQKIVFAVGEYSLEVKQKTNQDMAADLSAVAESANSITNAYKQAVERMESNDADMAKWSELCYGTIDRIGIMEASIQNRHFLTVGDDIDGQLVMPFYDRLDKLMQDGAIEVAGAAQLNSTAKVLEGLFRLHDELCEPLTEMESLALAAGSDYTRVDQSRVAQLFAEAKNIVSQINDVSKAYNDGKQEAMMVLNKLEGPNGMGFVEFLEQAYVPKNTEIYITTTPGPQQPNVLSTILPPTSTITPTLDPCLAAATADDGRTSIGFEWGIEYLADRMKVHGYADVEGYFKECLAWTVVFPDTDGDGKEEWALVQDIALSPGLNKWGQIDYSQKNFRLVIERDKKWAEEEKYMIFRQDSNEVVWRDWLFELHAQATATQAAAEIAACRPPDTNTYTDYNKFPTTWQQTVQTLGSVEGRQRWGSCGNSRYWFTIEHSGRYWWYIQRDYPTNIPEGTYFWVNYQGQAYVWQPNPTATPRPADITQCRVPFRPDVYKDSSKISTRWQNMDSHPSLAGGKSENVAWYGSCGSVGYWFIALHMVGQNFNVYWFVQADNPSGIGQNDTFWVEGGQAVQSPHNFDPPQ